VKFLCVPCDKAMVLDQTAQPEPGSFSLVYSCPDCGYECAMLTNPMESQMVGSLGVKLGAEGQTESKCRFTSVVQEMNAEAQLADAIGWTVEAEARLDALPEFVRPMVRKGVERYARDRGHDRIDDRVLDEARDAMTKEAGRA